MGGRGEYLGGGAGGAGGEYLVEGEEWVPRGLGCEYLGDGWEGWVPGGWGGWWVPGGGRGVST